MPRLSKIGAAALAAFGWTSGGSANVTASYLQVAGGGGGGTGATSSTIGGGGGGGAGGLLTGTVSLSGATTYTVTVGAGGAGGIANTSNSTAGGNSQFGTLTASIGGGLGGNYNGTNAGSGGSGGGGAYGNPSGGSGTSGQGYAGGTADQAGQPYGHGGGGGAGAVGGSSSTGVSPTASGGIGVASSITGTSTYYAGGGGSGSGNSSYLGGPGGNGGGGNGGYGTVAGTAGLAGFGGGGGGGGNQGVGGTPSSNGGNGGSGVVIISYPAPQLFWGGFITTSGSNIIHTFTSSGSLTPITTTTSANYLVIAGGGSGGFFGAGGAGGALAGSTTLSLSSSYTIVVGAGGAGYSSKGSDSTFSAIGTTAYGGGSGPSGSGGSGGGGLNNDAGGSGVAGQGYAGGQGKTDGATYNSGGGGGGAGGLGGNSAGYGGSAGLGGTGIATTLLGGTLYFAGGGGGGGDSRGVYGNYGGTGGGGTGGTYGNSFNGQNATISTGSGGGGAGYNGSGYGLAGSGGSGVVIIAYPGQQLFGGGVVSYANGNTVHTFNTSGTLTPLVSLTADYLIVAGGGGSGTAYPSNVGSAGGGAGGMLTGSGVTIDTNSTYLVLVGSGGAGGSGSLNAPGIQGSNSFFSIVPYTAIGGGYGNTYLGNGGNGGSGGGAGRSGTGGFGTTGQGNSGGYGDSSGAAGGGGGGAGASGTNSPSSGVGGAGGNGLTSSISGTSTYYAGGGGGGGNSSGGAAGLGGGGAGASGSGSVGTAGTANTGGGAGGSSVTSGSNYIGAQGGSGVVIIRYAGSTQLMAGGTVTITGGYVIHKFTSSGYLAPLKYVGNSLRFRASNTARLSRTVTVASSGTQGTLSFWCKKGKDWDSNNNGNIVAGADSYNYAQWFQQGFYFGNTTNWMNTAAVYRDYAAWYHVVCIFDTTLATSTDRLQIWVNGVRQTAGGVTSYPSQNASFPFLNSAQAWYIGGRASNDNMLDGYLAEVNFVDGQALTPNSFGAFNSYGVWQPITYGGSYGTNGFYLPFNANAASYAGTFNNSNYLTVPDSSAWAFSGNWTVEAFFYVANFSSTLQSVVAQWVDGGGGDRAFTLGVNSSAQVQTYVQYGGNQYALAGPANLVANTWYHAALVVNGTTLTLYINGVAVGSTTVSGSINNSSAPVGIGAYGNGSWKVTGGISNVRITNTAVYTSNFTVPTANLTAVSGTQLLTCQNATFVDNSSNAFTITNNGSVTSGQTYPFSVNIFKDQGPAGNNWTPSNISVASGPTLDIVTDVPTLTSATASNTCTLNPLFVPTGGTTYFALSNGNLTITGTSSANSGDTIGTMANATGKFYYEFTMVGVDASGNCTVAACDVNQLAATTTYSYCGYLSKSYAYNAGGYKINNSTGSAYGSTFTTGDIISVALDCDNGAIYFAKNGVWQASGVPTSGASKTNAAFTWTGGSQTMIPQCEVYRTGSIIGANFGQQPFAYTPPSGYVALNTYNL